MSKVIKLAQGEATVSETVTYSLKKKINSALFRGRLLDASGVFSVSYEAMEESKLIGMLGLIEKIVLNGEEKPVNEETLDSMLVDDHEKLALAVNAILNPVDESKKKKN